MTEYIESNFEDTLNINRKAKKCVSFDFARNFTINSISVFTYLTEKGFHFDEISPSMFKITKT